MKHFAAGLMFAWVVAAGSAADAPANPVTPQPRVRLDPVSRTAVPEPSKAERDAADANAVFMEKYFVRGRSAAPRRKTQDPHGTFSLMNGGRFAGKDAKPSRVEFGLWSHIDLMDDDARFRPPQTHPVFDLIRIHW